MKIHNKLIDLTIVAMPVALTKIITDQVEHWSDKKKRSKIVKKRLSDNSESQTELVPICFEVEYSDTEIIDKCQNVTFDLKSAVSPIISAAIQDGIISQNGKNLLECINMTPDMMKVWKDNPNVLHGYQMNGNKFGGQGRFIPAQFPTPLLVFQLASIVTGQYFQSQISEQMSIINKKLDFLINNKFDKDISSIQAKLTWINEKMALKTYYPDDIGKADSMLVELDQLRLEYRRSFSKIEFQINYKVGSNLQEAAKWERCVKESNIESIMEIAYIAEIGYLLINMLLYKIYVFLKKDNLNERILQCTDRHDIYFYKHYAKKYHDLKILIETNLEGLEKTGEYKVDSISKIRKNRMDKFEAIESKFTKVGMELNPKQYLLINDGECIGIYSDVQTKLTC